jgi:hypothetical protein
MIDWGFKRQVDGDDWPKYDLVRQAELLADATQKEPVERAIRSPAFRFAIHCPQITNLSSNRSFKGYDANYGEDNLRITAALLHDFYWHHSGNAKIGRAVPKTEKKKLLFNILSKGPGYQAVRDALHIGNKGLAPLINGVTTNQITDFIKTQSAKIKTSAAIIEGYMTAGEAIPIGGRAPYGFSIMVEALIEERILDKSDRTVSTYFAELESAAVLHYLMVTNGVYDYLQPVYPLDEFPIKCMDAMVRFSDARKIFSANNLVARYLNKYFGFQFTTFPVRFLRDHYFAKKLKKNQALADRIRLIRGHST